MQGPNVKVLPCLVPLINSHINEPIGKLTMEIKNDEHLNDLITSQASTFHLHESHS